jgi:hypothetical protein
MILLCQVAMNKPWKFIKTIVERARMETKGFYTLFNIMKNDSLARCYGFVKSRQKPDEAEKGGK